MNTPDLNLPSHERRRFPRYYVNTRLTLAIEDVSLQESIGLGEPGDISLGGLRVCNLPACPNVTPFSAIKHSISLKFKASILKFRPSFCRSEVGRVKP